MNSTTLTSERTLAVFAHELREPLSSILLAAQAMVETGTDTSVYRELSGLITRQGRYLARIIDGVLESRHQNGETCHLHREWFDLAHVIDEAVETAGPLLRQRHHELRVSLPTRPVYLCADPVRVQQVIVNLLTNAAKYTEPGGSIGVTVVGTNEHLTITVRDNGSGISPALLPRIFHLFEQEALRLPSAKYAGLGVGLAVVKSVVELHGGRVSVHSDGLGTGSTFRVELPVFIPEASGKLPVAPGRRSSSPRSDLATLTPMLDA